MLKIQIFVLTSNFISKSTTNAKKLFNFKIFHFTFQKTSKGTLMLSTMKWNVHNYLAYIFAMRLNSHSTAILDFFMHCENHLAYTNKGGKKCWTQWNNFSYSFFSRKKKLWSSRSPSRVYSGGLLFPIRLRARVFCIHNLPVYTLNIICRVIFLYLSTLDYK